MKPRIGIFDLTDCEGCELQFLGLKENLLDFTQDYEIANWRLVQPHLDNLPDIDVAIIQGTVVTENDQNLLKTVREKSRILVALGECARTGWIPTWIKKEDRPKAISYVYSQNYTPKTIDALPLKDVVKVDLEIPGCPPTPKAIENFLNSIPDILNKKEVQ